MIYVFRSCTLDRWASPICSPVAFPKKYDAEGKFVKHYLPALRKFPAKYIYEPWKAPLSIQKEAGCIIGCVTPPLVLKGLQVIKVLRI